MAEILCYGLRYDKVCQRGGVILKMLLSAQIRTNYILEIISSTSYTMR